MTPQVGDYGVVRTEGTGSALIRWATNSPVNHAFVYVGGGKIVEAEPGGAVLSPASKYAHTAVWSTGRIGLASVERAAITEAAHAMIGTPYGWLDFAAIALAQHRLGGLIDAAAPVKKQPWWVRRVTSLKTLICSQLVDVAYETAGVHLFNDGRLPGLVSPGDLLNLLAATSVKPAA